MSEVTVIIPTYNRPQFLRDAIASVMNQTYQNFSIIVVDDASSEENLSIINDFDSRRLRYIRHGKNLGGSARNTGIKAADSPYIAFLDDDDKWLPEKLRLQVDLLNNCLLTVGGVYTGSLTVDRETKQVLSYNIAQKRGALDKELFHRNWIGGTSTILLRRSCFDKVGLFDETLPSFQDYDLWIRIAKYFDFDVVERPLFEYIVHKNKIWANPGAISKGIELFLEKHGKSPGLRKYFSNHYLSLGVFFSYQGDTKKAIHSYVRAITLYPYEMRNYFNLCLCLLGSKNYEKGKRIRASFVKALHQVMQQQ